MPAAMTPRRSVAAAIVSLASVLGAGAGAAAPPSDDTTTTEVAVPTTAAVTTTTTTTTTPPTTTTTGGPAPTTPAPTASPLPTLPPPTVETPPTVGGPTEEPAVSDVPPDVPDAVEVLPPVLLGVDSVCFAADAPESGVFVAEFVNSADVGFTLVVRIDGPITEEKTIQAPPGGTGGENFSLAFSGLPSGSYTLTATNDAGSVTRQLEIEPCPGPPPPTPGCTVSVRDDVFVVRPSDRLVVDAPGVLRNDETCGHPAVLSSVVSRAGAVSFIAPDFAAGLVHRTYHVQPSPGVTHEGTITIVVAGEPCTIGESDSDFVVVTGATVAIPFSHIFDTECPNAVDVDTIEGLEHGNVQFEDTEILFTPDDGFIGVDVIDVVARRHGTIIPEFRPTVTIHVVPGPPCDSSVADDAFETEAGTTLELTVASGPAANDILCAGDRFEIVSPPSSGVAELGPAGELRYVPEPQFTGTVEFTYRLVGNESVDVALAGGAASSTTAPATVTIEVTAGAPPPSTVAPPTPTSTPAPPTTPPASTPTGSAPPATTGPPSPSTTGDIPAPSPTSPTTTSPPPLPLPPGRLPATR